VFPQVDQREHDAYGEEGSEHNARYPSLMDVVIWYVARRRIHPTAIAEHVRFEIVEDEVTSRVVRNGIVAVYGVIPMFKCGQVEVDAIEDRVC